MLEAGYAILGTHKLDVTQRQYADVGFRANTSRKSVHLGISSFSQERSSTPVCRDRLNDRVRRFYGYCSNASNLLQQNLGWSHPERKRGSNAGRCEEKEVPIKYEKRGIKGKLRPSKHNFAIRT